MRRDNPAGDREPKPRSLSVTRSRWIHPVEAFKHPRQMLRRDANSGVGHPKDRPSAVAGRGDGHPSAGRRELDPVVHQIEQQLGETCLVALDDDGVCARPVDPRPARGREWESTAETATPCLLNFVDRKDYLELMQSHSEIGLHTAQALSRDYQAAYRDIHDLVLTRSSAGKLARLLLSYSPMQGMEAETRIHSTMTHEEMAQRIGSSRETVTRLLSVLKKKQLIRLDGPTLVIRDRSALEALAV